MALITSKGTMDKENPAVRKYIAQRADLLGAIRLPNNTFKGNAGQIDKMYRDRKLANNKLLTQNVRIGLDGRKHKRNLKMIVCGGSGAGKTRFFCKPNAMQCNTSYVILDPKGENLRDTGRLLEELSD